ncbi:hypothetical protein [Pedobacter steynii]|uniref:hypothetical protein n=1 Tax=Pedobacter steynii TaxID=430522 RepID=UPI001C409AA1|nr:hypothetical protein [Pedobacter steynii]
MENEFWTIIMQLPGREFFMIPDVSKIVINKAGDFTGSYASDNQNKGDKEEVFVLRFFDKHCVSFVLFIQVDEKCLVVQE